MSSRYLVLDAESCLTARRLLGWSQGDFEAASGLSRPTVISLEKGRRVSPASVLKAVESFSKQGLEPSAYMTARDQIALAELTAAEAKASLLRQTRYVVIRFRPSGGAHVVFQLARPVRPQGWPPLIRLPLGTRDLVDIRDPAVVGRIVTDARRLYEDYLQGRASPPYGPGARR